MKRLLHIVIGAAAFIALEIFLEGLQYTNPPDWFYPVWMIVAIVFEIISLPARIATSVMMALLPSYLQPEPLPKPTLAQLGMLYTGILVMFDGLEGAFIGWMIFYLKKKRI